MASFLWDAQHSYSTTGVSCDKRAAELVHRVAECEKVWSREHALRWLQKRQNDSILWQYRSDVTPLSSRQTWSQEGGGISVKRFGKACHEFLIQRCFLTDLDDVSVGVFEESLTLEKGVR